MANRFCITPTCNNLAAPARRVCYKCRSARWKELRPLSYHFNALRNNARRRGHSFSLSFEEFKKLVAKSGYYDQPRTDKMMPSFDRINVHEGYHIDNIQVIPLSINCQKRSAVDYGDMPLDQFMEKYKDVAVPF